MFVPLLALGLPGHRDRRRSCSAAHQTYGIQPGPTLMADQPDLVWTLLASLLIGNTLLLVINLPLAPLWAKLLRIPRPQLYAGILFFASLGAYSVNADPFDLALLLFFGGVGFAIRRFGIPVLPLILGVILGPLMELKLREALDLSERRHQRAVQRGARDLRLRADRAGDRAAGRARPAAPSPGRPRSPEKEEVAPMTVVVGYIPDQYGEAALAAGIEEARAARHRPRGRQRDQGRRPGRPALRRRGGAGRRSRSGSPALGVAHEVRQAMGADVAEEMVRVGRRDRRPT